MTVRCPDERQRAAEIEVLAAQPRAIIAMRRAFQERRFGLVFGAGVSRAFDFEVPDWKQLLSRIARHDRVNGEEVDQTEADSAARAALLFGHFAARVRGELARDYGSILGEQGTARLIKGEWKGLIRDILYAGAPDASELANRHPYLRDFLDVMIASPMTITYNFDSYLEMMLGVHRTGVDERGRPYETVFDGAMPFRSSTGVIYHPNGYLPKNVLERASDELVFSEEEFEDQLLASVAGRYSSLAHHLSKSVCLFIGLSLNDETLRYLLRRNAINNPGHYHYIVEWVDTKDEPLPERRRALFEYRFGAYNLITLFLANEGIGALGRLLRRPYDELRSLADEAGVPTKYVFYLSGIPGIGKTTVLRHMASLSIYDEWLSDPLPLLARPYDALDEGDRARIDDWIAKQLRDKNEALLREREGIFVVERGPLDPLSFVPEDGLRAKAEWYRARLVPTMFDEVCEGAVLVLWGDPVKVSARITSRQQIQQKPDYLKGLQNTLRGRIYRAKQVVQMHSTDWDVPQLVREVSREVHLGGYKPVNLKTQLERLASGDRRGGRSGLKLRPRRGRRPH